MSLLVRIRGAASALPGSCRLLHIRAVATAREREFDSFDTASVVISAEQKQERER